MSGMGKASKTKQDASRRERIAEQRAAARRAEQRKRIYLAAGSIVVVAAIVVAFVLVKAGSGGNSAGEASNGPTGAALTAVVNDVTSVPASTLDAIGDGGGSVTGKPTSITGPALTSGGKPEMLYIGAEYCPYCAGTRWAMIVALSRFGTFSGLRTIHSSTTDTPSNIPTWTFYQSRYTSNYLTFTPVETTTNVLQGNSYPPLQTPTAQQQQIQQTYDPNGTIPFISFGNRYMLANAPYDVTLLQGKTWAQIASALKDPSSPVAKAIGGAANYMTAAICKLTGNQPASACTPAVKALQSQL
jgi:thiol-disulfide isomerase/thioredoxin